VNIAVIAWGSLVPFPQGTKPDDVPLELTTAWSETGPMLPVEFSRISCDGRLTLVIDHTAADPCRTFDAKAKTELDAAKENLRLRERMPSAKNIGSMKKGDAPTDATTIIIGAWLATKDDYDAAIWTGLPPNFEAKSGQKFDAPNALRYLDSLKGAIRDEAYTYIVEAPETIGTPVRKDSHLPEGVAAHEAGHFLAAIALGLTTVWISHVPYAEAPGADAVRGHKVEGERKDQAKVVLDLAGPWAQLVLYPNTVPKKKRDAFHAAGRVIPMDQASWPQFVKYYHPLGWMDTDMRSSFSLLAKNGFPFLHGVTNAQALVMIDTNLGQWMQRPQQLAALRHVRDRMIELGQVIQGEPLLVLRKEVLAMVDEQQRLEIMPAALR
jgi:hypothetical protein